MLAGQRLVLRTVGDRGVPSDLLFRQFFEQETNGGFLLQDEPKELMIFEEPGEWDDEEVWVEEPQTVAGFQRQ